MTFNRHEITSFKSIVTQLVQSCCTEPVEIVLHRASNSRTFQATARAGWTKLYCGRSELRYMEALEELKSRIRVVFRSSAVLMTWISRLFLHLVEK